MMFVREGQHIKLSTANSLRRLALTAIVITSSPIIEKRMAWYNTGFTSIEKINATAPHQQRNVLNYFAIFKNIAHSLEPGVTPIIEKRVVW